MKIILSEKQIELVSLLKEQNTPQIPKACKAYYSDTKPTYYANNAQNRKLNRVGEPKGVKVVTSEKMLPAFELCYELQRNQQKYKQSIMFPLVSSIVNHKKDKWVDAVGEDEIRRVHDVLDKLHDIDPNKQYRWPEHLDDLTAGIKYLFLKLFA